MIRLATIVRGEQCHSGKSRPTGQFDASGKLMSLTTTRGDGTYRSAPLAPGSYFVRTFEAALAPQFLTLAR